MPRGSTPQRHLAIAGQPLSFAVWEKGPKATGGFMAALTLNGGGHSRTDLRKGEAAGGDRLLIASSSGAAG
jgi:hypothetical protein